MKTLRRITTHMYSTDPKVFESNIEKILAQAKKYWPDEYERKDQVCNWCCKQLFWGRIAEEVWSRLEFMIPPEEHKINKGDKNDTELLLRK